MEVHGSNIQHWNILQEVRAAEKPHRVEKVQISSAGLRLRLLAFRCSFFCKRTAVSLSQASKKFQIHKTSFSSATGSFTISAI